MLTILEKNDKSSYGIYSHVSLGLCLHQGQRLSVGLVHKLIRSGYYNS